MGNNFFVNDISSKSEKALIVFHSMSHRHSRENLQEKIDRKINPAF